ncbi:apolipoprotein C-I [Pempheris klunzingeri]|uniref:apolipoprotein C-I n=1 Tax=Pempheris klunzingeri TaxID=3127111 RepID=UPI00397EA77F
MRLYLAVAVLMLAFVAYTEAQEETVEQRLTRFGGEVTEMSKTLADKAKAAFEQIQTSEIVSKTSDWFQQQFEILKTKISETTQ